MKKKVILLTTGDPAGIGPDISLDMAFNYLDPKRYLVVLLGDVELLRERARMLNQDITIIPVVPDDIQNSINNTGELFVVDITCPKRDCLGKLAVENASYVLQILNTAVELCKEKIADGIVTAPISKEILNRAGIQFSGHTEYLRDKFGCKNVVMMLVNPYLKVALLTTHLPLRRVADSISVGLLEETLQIIYTSFKEQYGIGALKVAVCGLNPHAGEGGYLGDEELTIINPVIKRWQRNGYLVSGAYSADTIFNHAKEFDVILAMYHDQGLPVLKYSGFETGVNVTLGLPILRTSVDHGTALDLAGSGRASSKSLIEAFKYIYTSSIRNKSK